MAGGRASLALGAPSGYGKSVTTDELARRLGWATDLIDVSVRVNADPLIFAATSVARCARLQGPGLADPAAVSQAIDAFLTEQSGGNILLPPTPIAATFSSWLLSLAA